jgi:hypothetical protein
VCLNYLIVVGIRIKLPTTTIVMSRQHSRVSRGREFQASKHWRNAVDATWSQKNIHAITATEIMAECHGCALFLLHARPDISNELDLFACTFQ